MPWRSAPICDKCWIAKEGEREPVRLKVPEVERCVDCGVDTVSGIYVRRLVSC